MTIRNSVCNPAVAEEARRKWVGVLVWRVDVFGKCRGLFAVKSVRVTEWDKGGRKVQELEFRLTRAPEGEPAPACLLAERFVLPYEEGVKRGFKP